jgi:hypothetical protein
LSTTTKALKDFLAKVQEQGFWKACEIKTYLVRQSHLEPWKIVVLRVELMHQGDITAKELLTNDRIKMLKEVCDTNLLDEFLIEVSSRTNIGEESASLELITGEFQYAFKERQYSFNEFNIDYPCHTLSAGGNRTDWLNKVEDELESLPLPKSPNYNGITDACQKLLNIKYYKAYSPNVLVLAPLFIRIEDHEFSDRQMKITLKCAREIEMDAIVLEIYASGHSGQQNQISYQMTFNPPLDIQQEWLILTNTVQMDYQLCSFELKLYYSSILVEHKYAQLINK